MTIREVYEGVSGGGATDFALVVEICRSAGPFCLVGGLAVNCYAEPVYTMDADLVAAAPQLARIRKGVESLGFVVREEAHSLNAQAPRSQLRIQFTTDPRYADFPARATEHEVLGARVPVAALEDLVRGKTWAFEDTARRPSKRKKDELDLIRIGEAHPEICHLLPLSVRDFLKAAEQGGR